MSGQMKIMTVVGTRPEIIRLSCVIDRLDSVTRHILVHTGQNYDYELNQVFFDDLRLRAPDVFLNSDTSSLGSVLADVLKGTERVILDERPDAMVVLGDTNSCVAAVMGRRLKVPVFHLEAGNRSFDQNVPEEINRHLVDHVSDYNLAYTEHSRRNLLAEGCHPSSVMVMGSPMREVLLRFKDDILASDILTTEGLIEKRYLLASIHREENVDRKDRLHSVFSALEAVADSTGMPVLVSTHPRTRARITEHSVNLSDAVRLHRPLGFHDYNRLQVGAYCVLSDSGTIAEESAILKFPAVTIRDAIERPEAIDSGSIIAPGLNRDAIVDAVNMTVLQHSESGPPASPVDYGIVDSSRRVVNFIRSMTGTHHMRNGIRA